MFKRRESFEREIGDSLLQIISVAILGAIIGLLSSEYTRKKEAADKRTNEDLLKQQSENELRKETARKIHKLYGDIKKIRRRFRGKAFFEPYYRVEKDSAKIKAEEYDFFFEIINDSQIELEFIAKEISLNETIFKYSHQIMKHIKRINVDVFDKLITEYEESRSKFSGDSATLEIGALKYLKAFIAQRKHSKVFIAVICYYKNLIKLIDNKGDGLHDCMKHISPTSPRL